MNNVINLLVIDDDEINVFITSKIVKKTGYEVMMTSKSNGQEAVDYLTDLKRNDEPLPNLMLVDINMPVMGGWEFLKVFEEMGIERVMDTYVLTSSVFHLDIEKAKQFKSVNGFISKPLLIEQLVKAMEKVDAEPVCCD